MQKLNLVCVLLLLATVVSAQSDKLIPIVELGVGGVIGGVRDGRWVKDTETAPLFKGRDQYRLIGWKSGAAGQMLTGGKPEANVPCEEFYAVKFNSKISAGVAIGSAAAWDPVPRVPAVLAANNATYRKIVGEVLRSKGITKPNAQIKQAYRVDLDGDGIDEVVLAATYFKGGHVSPRSAAGDYSFVLLRKVVDGTAQNVIIAGEFIEKAVEFGAQNEYKISALADLNGDGNMEIVVYSQYYEGNGASVYEIDGASATEVLTTGCGV